MYLAEIGNFTCTIECVVDSLLWPQTPESNSLPCLESLRPVPEVIVCGTLSLFVQMTVVPVFILNGFGWKALPDCAAALGTVETLTVEDGAALPTLLKGRAKLFDAEVVVVDLVVVN